MARARQGGRSADDGQAGQEAGTQPGDQLELHRRAVLPGPQTEPAKPLTEPAGAGRRPTAPSTAAHVCSVGRPGSCRLGKLARGTSNERAADTHSYRITGIARPHTYALTPTPSPPADNRPEPNGPEAVGRPQPAPGPRRPRKTVPIAHFRTARPCDVTRPSARPCHRNRYSRYAINARPPGTTGSDARAALHCRSGA